MSGAPYVKKHLCFIEYFLNFISQFTFTIFEHKIQLLFKHFQCTQTKQFWTLQVFIITCKLLL